MEPTSTGHRQGRTSPQRVIFAGGLHRHHAHRDQPGCRPLLQPAWDREATDQGGQRSHSLDTALLSPVPGHEVRLLLGVIAYNLGNLLRRLALPLAIQSWLPTSLQQRLFKTGGRLIRHARYFILQLAASQLTQRLFRRTMRRIERLVSHPT
jgi:hypothetical protein